MMALLKKNIFQLNIFPLCSVKITGGPMQLEFQTHVNLSFLAAYTSSRISKKILKFVTKGDNFAGMLLLLERK